MLLALLAAASLALPADLAKAAHDYDRAQVTSDRAELERLIADDYVLHNSQGQAQDKASFIADQVAPGYRLEPFKIEQPVEKVMGDTAILGGVARAKGLAGGQPFDVKLRFIDVWRKRDGAWKVVFSQATRVP
ncbi:nuclear transport factor 2 family protein [Phenylobacterium sp. VNQ135]|uniref:nuclear transport factor 2 family protein n=1 Tax=Phenylobacterium sp. VNQ135 TaxID=3400922 RepID=UPI003C0FC00F